MIRKKQSGPSSRRMKRGERRQNWKPADFKSKRLQLGEKKCGEKLASGNKGEPRWRFLFELGAWRSTTKNVKVSSSPSPHATAVYINEKGRACVRFESSPSTLAIFAR